MVDSCRKISRGQVWFLVDNDVPLVHTSGSVQGKNRPWLVVSNNQCNQSSPIYTVVPLTTAPKKDLPTHVTFQTGDKTQTILCEQIRTVSQQVFFNTGSYYKWTMSEKYMAMVDEALAEQLGLSLVFPNAERYWASLEKLIRVKVKQAIMDSKVEAIDVSKVACLLDAKVEAIVKGEVNPAPVEESRVEAPISESTPEPEEPVKKRRTWTDESKKEFLEYLHKYGSQAAALEYDIKIGSVYSLKMKFSKESKESKEKEDG